MKPTTDRVRPLVAAIYKRSVVGCCLHIAMDDGNVDDDDIEFCILQAQAAGHDDCERVGGLLLQMSRTQRKKVRATWHLPVPQPAVLLGPVAPKAYE